MKPLSAELYDEGAAYAVKETADTAIKATPAVTKLLNGFFIFFSFSER